MKLAGNTLTVDFNGNGAPLQPQTVHSLSWRSFCAEDFGEAELTWNNCSTEEYWEELNERYGDLTTEPGDTPEMAAGRLTMIQFFYLSLTQGVNSVVKSGGQPYNSGAPNSDTTLADNFNDIRLAKTAMTYVVNQVVLAKYLNPTAVLQSIGATVNAKNIADVKANQLEKIKKYWDKFRKLPTWAQGVIAVIVIVLIAYVIFDYFANSGGDSGKSASSGDRISGFDMLKIGIAVGLGVALPIYTVHKWMKLGSTFKQVMLGRAAIRGTSRMASYIGTAIIVAVVWGFFIHSILDNGIAFGSTAFNSALASTIATTIYLVVLGILSATVIGLILVGLLTLIDTLLEVFGAGFTISGEIIKFIAAAIYSYDMMIEIDPKKNTNMVDTGAPAAMLANPMAGYVEGNAITVSMPVTTNIFHKQPAHSDWKVVPYLWFFDEDNFRSSTFKYSLTEKQAKVDASRGSMKNEWQDVVEYDDRLMAEFYRGHAMARPALPAVTPSAGINRQVGFWFNMGYEIPAYTCWLVPIPLPPYGVPICYKKDEEGDNSSYVTGPIYDILPATLDAFMEPRDTGNGGIRPAWDSGFADQWDFDGDGLTSKVKGGIDPNELTWDNDGDGLSDKYELGQRERGQSFSANMWDTDSDGLNDAEELKNGSNPALQDTDNDGLADGLEVRYELYNIVNNQPVATGDWVGGWDVWIAPWEDPETSTTPPQSRPGAIKVRVASDPTERDPDGDGIPDDAERFFALSSDWRKTLDPNGQPYHPNVYNTPPLNVDVTSNADGDFIKPGQSLIYTSTIEALADFNPGVLQVDAPDVLGGGPLLYAFHLSKNMTQAVRSDMTVDWSAPSQMVELSSKVRARLEPEPDQPVWKFIANDQVVNPDTTTQGRALDVTWSRPDRSDGYLLSTLTSNSGQTGGRGDIRIYPLPNGAASNVDSDNNNNWYLRGEAAPTSVCNDNGRCMVVWDQQNNCATVRLDWLQVIDEGDDHDTSGIEPYVLYLEDNNGGRTNWELPGSPYQMPWAWYYPTPSWPDMDSGDVAGPNSHEFPVYRDFCNTARLQVWESDGTTSSNPANMVWADQERLPGFIELRPDRFYSWKARLGPSAKSEQ